MFVALVLPGTDIGQVKPAWTSLLIEHQIRVRMLWAEFYGGEHIRKDLLLVRHPELNKPPRHSISLKDLV